MIYKLSIYEIPDCQDRVSDFAKEYLDSYIDTSKIVSFTHIYNNKDSTVDFMINGSIVFRGMMPLFEDDPDVWDEAFRYYCKLADGLVEAMENGK